MTKSFALALHTTTEELSIAIAAINQSQGKYLNYVRDRSWPLGRSLSTRMHDCLIEVMDGVAWSDVAFMAIARGIGSFTGTRIGIVLARTLGEQLEIPVYAVNCERILNQWQNTQQDKSLSWSLLEIAFDQWHQGIYPHWSEALPEYGSP